MNNTNKTQVWAPSIYMQATFDVESNPTFPKNKNSLSSSLDPSLILSSNISLISEIKGKWTMAELELNLMLKFELQVECIKTTTKKKLDKFVENILCWWIFLLWWSPQLQVFLAFSFFLHNQVHNENYM